LAKIDRSMRKSLELTAEAETLERRAARAEKHPSISSDDPDAVTKLQAKVAELDAQREKMRAANAAIRAGGDVVARLRVLGFTEERARKLLQPDPLGRAGFPAYALQNASGERVRLVARIRELEARQAASPRASETVGEVTISESDNRVRISFPAIPSEAVRKQLKGAGFRWSPTAGAWQRMASQAAWAEARRILSADAAATPAVRARPGAAGAGPL